MPKRIIFIAILLISIAGVAAAAYLISREDKGIQPVSPIQKTVIGKTKDAAVKNLPNIKKTNILSDGKIQYVMSSPIPLHPDEIQTQNGIVVFERLNAPINPASEGYAKISEYVKLFGAADETIPGSRAWGGFVSTYIYAQRGLAFIGNDSTDEIYEIQTFAPTSAENYKKLYGTDIIEGPVAGESLR